MSRFLLLLSLCGLVVVPHGNAQMWPRRTARRLRAFDPYIDVDVVEGDNGYLYTDDGSTRLARPGYGYLVNRQLRNLDEYKYCAENFSSIHRSIAQNQRALMKCMKTQGWYFSYRSGRWHPSEERRREDDKRYASTHDTLIGFAPFV
jgi:hypothetical protein